MNRIDAEQYKVLKREFERIKPQLLVLGRRVDGTGAWARGMLTFVPALLLFIERERKIATPSRDVFEGITHVYCDFIRHAIRVTLTPAERINGFDTMMRHFDQIIRPKLMVTEGGILLPGGQMLQ